MAQSSFKRGSQDFGVLGVSKASIIDVAGFSWFIEWRLWANQVSLSCATTGWMLPAVLTWQSLSNLPHGWTLCRTNTATHLHNDMAIFWREVNVNATFLLASLLVLSNVFLFNQCSYQLKQVWNIISRLVFVLQDHLFVDSVFSKQTEHDLFESEVLFLHASPECHTLFYRILVYMIAQMDKSTASLDQYLVCPNDNSLRLGANQARLLIDLSDRHQATKQGTQLLKLHFAE